MIDMDFGQRLTVKSLVEAKQGKRIIHIGQKVHLLKYITGNYQLGKDKFGNFGTVVENAIEGVHFELIPGEVPFPDKVRYAPLDLSKLL